MKIFVPVAVAALTVSTVSGATAWIDGLTKIPNTDSYHMTPVHVVQARVQSDAPLWNETTQAFGSKYYKTAEGQFRGALDTVNTASVEGALMYVQAEGIDYRTHSVKCERKNKMKYVVFYDIVFTQTNETLAEYSSEYGPMLPMDGGQCTPVSGTSVFSKESVSLNGNTTVPQVGPFIGGELKNSNDHAPYPNCWWYSFPNTCPLSKWADKTDACRANTRQGLCEFGKLPDGVTCTYNYRILGYVPIDDVVGITSLHYANGTAYPSFAEFCADGKVEFETNADTTNTLKESIAFWEDPLTPTANAARSEKLLDAYADLVSKTTTTTQIDATIVAHMQALPTLTMLATENPPCYKNIKECATAAFGCKRELYGQICTVCGAAGDGCETAPSDFTFPTLVKATVAATSESSSASGSSTPSPSATAIATTSSAANVAMTVSALVATFGLSFLMG